MSCYLQRKEGICIMQQHQLPFPSLVSSSNISLPASSSMSPDPRFSVQHWPVYIHFLQEKILYDQEINHQYKLDFNINVTCITLTFLSNSCFLFLAASSFLITCSASFIPSSSSANEQKSEFGKHSRHSSVIMNQKLIGKRHFGRGAYVLAKDLMIHEEDVDLKIPEKCLPCK